MASLTIRNLDNNLKTQLRLRAASHGCSMEAEVRSILQQTLAPAKETGNFAVAVHARFAAQPAVELPIPPRQPVRNPPEFEQ